MHTLFLDWIILVPAFGLRPSPALIQLRLQMLLPSKCHPQTWAAFWAVTAARAWLCHLPACSAHLSVTALCSISRDSAADMPFQWATDEIWFSSKLFHYCNFFFFFKCCSQNFVLPDGADLNSLCVSDLYLLLLFQCLRIECLIATINVSSYPVSPHSRVK